MKPVLVLCCLFALGCALPLNSFNPVHHLKAHEASGDEQICLHIAVKHTDAALKNLDEKFWAVSTPNHADYGKHVHLNSLHQLIDPSRQMMQNAATIEDWLSSASNGQVQSATSIHGDWVKACMKVSVAKSVFGTTLHHYHPRSVSVNDKTQTSRIRASSAITGVPHYVADKIDFIGGLNTPIHRHERLWASRQPSSLPASAAATTEVAAIAQVTELTVGDVYNASTPKLQRTYAANRQLSANFKIYCANGQLNTDAWPAVPCSSNPPSIASFNIRLSAAPETPRPTSVTSVSPAGAYCSVDNDPASCSVLLEVPYLSGSIISVQSVFSDNNLSPYAVAMYPTFANPLATPQFLTELYGIPAGLRAKFATQSVAEFLDQYMNYNDLFTWQNWFGLPFQNVSVLLGPNNETEASISGGEAQLDIQVIMGIAPGAPTWFWSVGGLEPSSQQEPFLDWLYQMANTPNAPLVHSVSYADAEESLTLNYMDRLNTEFQKCGVRGLTLLFASGDDGIASYEGRTNKTKCLQSQPEFPSASPYILSVGGTQLSGSAQPVFNTAQNVYGVPLGGANSVEGEVVCTARLGGVITSGGGFSRVYPRPTYQDAAVKRYLSLANAGANSVPFPTYPNFYNAQGRAYPDVAGYSNNYPVNMGGRLMPESGTSASTPLWAGIITLLNDIRLANNQPPLGFVNPLLYDIAAKYPSVFNDVVTGDNKCLVSGIECCAQGFAAAPGWDAVTGLGSPKFIELANLIMNPTLTFPYTGAVAPSAPPTPTPVPTPTEDNNNSKTDRAFILAAIGVALGGVALIVAVYNNIKIRAASSHQPLLSQP